MSLADLTAAELREGFALRALSPVEAIDALAERIADRAHGADVRRRLAAAEAVGLGDYVEARAARARMRAAFAALFEVVDLLLTPVSAGPPVRVGEHHLQHLGDELPFRELVMGYTAPQGHGRVAGVRDPRRRGRRGRAGRRAAQRPAWTDRAVLAAAQALHEARVHA